MIRIAILVLILGAASLIAWRLGYFPLLANGGLRKLLDRLRQIPWIGLVLGTSGAYWIARLIGGRSVSRLLAGHEDVVNRLHGRRGFVTLLRLRAQ